ncbi:Macrolide export ATP-binding/permease protein MacB [Minicystis rosea]|nr:Macrolide export ATP-binding/permease protein MacB [Minicystis rosea]
MNATRALLKGGLGSLAIIVAILFAQRIVLPIAVLRLDEREPAVAAGALLGAAALGFVRARFADRLARVIRLNVLELYLAPFARGPVPSLPSAEAVTARLANALPLLVSSAADGLAVFVAAALAVPVVTLLLAHALGAPVLVPLALAGLAGAAVTVVASPRVEAAWTAAWERSRTFYTAISAGFEGAVDLRAHGRAEAFAERLREDVRVWSRSEGRARVHSTFSTWGALGATVAAGAAVLVLSGGALAPRGDLHRTSLLVLTAIPTLQSLVAGFANMVAARDELANVARQRAIAAAVPEAEVDELIDATAEIRLENVGYVYPSCDGEAAVRALSSLSLVIAKGESLAVVGPNGAGKTTLLHVLLGVVRPDRGRILVGGREARLDNRRLHERVAYLSQRPYEIADGTLRDNLCALDPGVTDARLLAALAEVGLVAALLPRVETEAAILDLPYGALSRGQARRAMLARALLRDADLLLLDEPEAHLDEASVGELRTILRKAARGRRVIAAVHDRELSRFADRVVELAPPETASAPPESASRAVPRAPALPASAPLPSEAS